MAVNSLVRAQWILGCNELKPSEVDYLERVGALLRKLNYAGALYILYEVPAGHAMFSFQIG